MLRFARWQSLALSVAWTVLLLCGAAGLGADPMGHRLAEALLAKGVP